jgi:hypothetical protein
LEENRMMILMGLSLLLGHANAGDAVLRPAFCKTEKDYRNAASRRDPHAWDMYTVGSRAISFNGSAVTGGAVFNYYQCGQKADGSYAWKLFNESRPDSGVYLIGQGEGAFGIKHINVSGRGSVNAKTGQGAASLRAGDFMDARQQSAFSRHEAVRDLIVVIASSQDNYVDGSYSDGNEISHEGVRLSFDLVFDGKGYKVVRK